jgi:hypothetical protein
MQTIERLRLRFAAGFVLAISAAVAQVSPGGPAGTWFDVTSVRPGFAPLTSLNTPQRRALEEFISQNERPTGDQKRLADRNRAGVLSAKILRELFPAYSFVKVPWEYQVEPGSLAKYSIPAPGAVFTVVALNDGGDHRFVFHSSGNREEYAAFLRGQRIRVTDETADRLSAAEAELYGNGSGPTKRYARFEWRLGCQETPLHAISSSEEERGAYFYQLLIDANDFVESGRLLYEVIERRKRSGTVLPQQGK